MRKKHPVSLIISACGAGYAPKAPGTFGSLVAIVLALFFYAYTEFQAAHLQILSGVLVSLIIYAIGVKASAIYMRETKTHDPSVIVIDEVAGQFLALALISPLLEAQQGVTSSYVTLVAVNFLLFRFFDIVKPWPVSYADKKMNSAHGVMLDDMFAGIYAAGVQYLAVAWLIG